MMRPLAAGQLSLVRRPFEEITREFVRRLVDVSCREHGYQITVDKVDHLPQLDRSR